MTRSVPTSLLIPVETLNREFDAKLRLALLASERGLRPIIGSRTTIHDNLRRLPRSIYLSKGIRVGNRVMLSILDRMGHIIVALDEEALIRISDEALLMMLDEATFNRPRLLYAWGKRNAEVWRRFEGYRGTPILEIGNPRVDLLTPPLRGYHEPDVARLRDRYGRFVLFSSNFSLVNHYIRDHVRFRVASGVSVERTQELKGGVYEHKAAVFEQFKALMPKLAATLRPHTLVIRPHPSENVDTWRHVCAGMENVQIVHEGPIAPWLIAASALVHNGCTSGVEAAILGTPAFAYRPVVSEAFDAQLPNSLSVECSTADELLQGVQRVVSEEGVNVALTPEQRKLLNDNVASLEGRSCCERILDSLTTHREFLESAPAVTAGDRLFGTAHHVLRGWDRAVRTRRRRSRSSSVYSAHKFPGIGQAEVEARIERFRAVVPGMAEMRARELLGDVFEIERV